MTKESEQPFNLNKEPKSKQLPEELYKKFIEYYNQYKEDVLKVAFYYTKQTEDAQDLAQKSFLKAYQQFTKYEEGRNFLSWILTIVRNTYFTEAKQKKRTMEMHENTVFPDHNSRSTEENILGKEAKEAIDKIISTLPKDLKEVIQLSHKDNLKDQDIAKKMNIPEGTVRNRLSRGRALIRAKLKEKGIVE